VASVTNFYIDFDERGANNKLVATNAADFSFVKLGVDIGFHACNFLGAGYAV
jgi:hypothetical protein